MIPSELLLEAYRRGIFPMGMEDGEIGWFSPDPRGIIPLDKFHVPHGLKRALGRRRFEIRINHSFEKVMRSCAARSETWINDEILESYCNLHRQGHAHSVEAWENGELAGGLYGVAIGGVFFGESMFHDVTEASKVALHALVERMRERQFALLDIQWVTQHLVQFGAIEISRIQYLKKLDAGVNLDCRF